MSFLSCLLCSFFLRHPLVPSSVMFGLVSRRMSFCVSLASLFMLLMSANSPSGWPGMISVFVLFVRVPLQSWSGLSLVCGSTCLCFSIVLSLPVASVTLLGSGVPMVLWAQFMMAVCFCRFNFYSFTIFSFSSCLFPTFFCFWLLAPCFAAWPFCSIRYRAISLVGSHPDGFFFVVVWFLPRFLTCTFVQSGLGVVLPCHVSL